MLSWIPRLSACCSFTLHFSFQPSCSSPPFCSAADPSLSAVRQFPAFLLRGSFPPFCCAAVPRLPASRQFPAFLLRGSFPPFCCAAVSRLYATWHFLAFAAVLQIPAFLQRCSSSPSCHAAVPCRSAVGQFRVPRLSVLQQCCSFPLFLLRGSSCSSEFPLLYAVQQLPTILLSSSF